MFSPPRIRIDMTLTDEHIFKIIVQLIPETKGLITYERLAEESKCGVQTVFRATRRLKSAGRLSMKGGGGRRPVEYEVTNVQAN